MSGSNSEPLPFVRKFGGAGGGVMESRYERTSMESPSNIITDPSHLWPPNRRERNWSSRMQPMLVSEDKCIRGIRITSDGIDFYSQVCENVM